MRTNSRRQPPSLGLIPGFILAVALGVGGCKVDRASNEAAQLDKTASPVLVAAAEPEPSGAAPAPDRTHPEPRPLIVCFGDSLTAGYGADQGQSYPDYLERDLKQRGFRGRVVNEGISGNTTKDGVDRLETVLALKPDIVVLEFGGNDGLRGLKIDTTRANIATMIEQLKQAGAKVILAGITLPPDYGAEYVQRFTRNYPELGRHFNVPVYPFLLKDVYGVEGMMQADGIHATGKGNAIVAGNVLPYVVRALKR